MSLKGKNKKVANISYYKNKNAYGFFTDGTKGYPKEFYHNPEECVYAAIKEGYSFVKYSKETYDLFKYPTSSIVRGIKNVSKG